MKGDFMLYLNIPFSEKDEAKSLFAKWDKTKKKWYATNPKYYYKFSKWINGNLVFSNSINIIEGKINCWKCKNEISVYGFAVESKNISDLSFNYPVDIFEITGYDLIIWPISDDIPSDVKTILENNFGCKTKYSRTVGSKYFANVCSFCDSLQGDNFVYNISAPFGEMNTSTLFLHKINLQYDLISNLTINVQVSPNIYYLNRSNFIETKYIVKK